MPLVIFYLNAVNLYNFFCEVRNVEISSLSYGAFNWFLEQEKILGMTQKVV